MKTFIRGLIFSLLLLPFHYAFAQGVLPPIPPAPTGGDVVLDTLDWLSPAQETEINAVNAGLDSAGIAQMAVVTLDDCGADKQKFRTNLFNAWGIGHANDDDGLLIMVCWYGGDPSRRSIEQTTGRGLQTTLTDSFTSQIAEEFFVPSFKADKPGDGLVAMVKEYDRVLRRQAQSGSSEPAHPYLVVGMLGVLPGLLFSMIYVNIWRSKNKLTTKKVNGLKKIAYQNEFMGVIFPTAKLIVAAEIISLACVLAGIFIGRQSDYVFPTVIQQYVGIVSDYLLSWCVILSVVYISPLVSGQKGDGRNSDGGRFFGGGGDSDGGSFGGGDSGGSGSSTGF